MSKNFTVNDLPRSERPRERLVKHGAEALSLNELLAIVLSSGTRGESVMTMSQNLLGYFGTLEGLCEASVEDIQKVKGIGPAKACQIKASLALAKRITAGADILAGERQKKSITQSDIFEIVKKQIGNYAKEHFIAISLDTRSRVLATDTIFVGTLNSSLVHPREIMEVVIKRHAASFIVAHNHPSGDPDPSDEDTKVTKLLFEAGQIMGITMLDHVIAGRNSFFSFRDNEVKNN